MPGGGEPLAQQQRQVIAHQPAQLGGGAEGAVGGRGLLLDAGQQISQARLAITDSYRGPDGEALFGPAAEAPVGAG